VIIDTVYDLTDGWWAYYNFTGGTLKDSSGNGNNISFKQRKTPATDRSERSDAYVSTE